MPEDKLLIAGIRPEYFEDKNVVEEHKLGDGATFSATVDVVEWLGNEAYAYIPYEAPPEVAEQLAQLERDLDSEALRTQLIVSLGSASRVRGGEQAELFVDARKMHLFDPSSGDNLTVVPEAAGTPTHAERRTRLPRRDAIAARIRQLTWRSRPSQNGARELELLELAGGGAGELVAELDPLRALVAGELRAWSRRSRRPRSSVAAGRLDDERRDELAPLLVGDADHGDLGDVGVLEDGVLDLDRRRRSRRRR